MKRLLLLFAILHSAFVIPAVAQVPNLTSYQGRVAVGTVNFDGTGQFKFALVNGTGPTLLWKNDGSSGNTEPTAAVALAVTKGLYSVLLGDTSLANMTAIPGSVWANADVRLRVWFNDGVNGFQLLTPDQRLTPNGYSLNATNISSGTLADARLSANIPRLDTFNAFTNSLSVGSTFTVAYRGGSTGANNNFIGGGAGGYNGTGSDNTFLGQFVGQFNTTGSVNTGVGSFSLTSNTTGGNNTAIGQSAMRFNTTGDYNTALGMGALQGTGTGSSNIGIGATAGYFTNGSNNIVIGHLGVTGESNIIRIGTSGTHTHTYLSGIIHGDGSGLTGLPAANLTGTLPAVSGANLTNLPAANLTGTLPAISGANLTSLNASNISSGTLADARLSANIPQLNASNAFTNSLSVGSTFTVNYFSGSTGANNNFIGGGAGYSNGAGSNNTFIGTSVGSYNTTGNGNSGLGAYSLNSNSTGGNNTAIGESALRFCTTGNTNTALGAGALQGTGTGSSNIGIGVSAGNYTNGSNNIVIGHLGVTGESNIIRIGTSGTHTHTYLTGVIHGDGSGLTNLPNPASATNFTGSLAGDVSGTQGATSVVTVGGITAANVASGANLAIAATNLNTASTIVKRDASGNFTAGTITAALNGNAATATSAPNFTGSLAGNVTGTQGATVVATVGGVTAANVASGANLANAATNANTASTIVKRDASGNFTAGTITANGSALTSLNATNISSGSLSDVRLSSNVALLDRATQNFLGATNTFAGNVGIGTSTPITSVGYPSNWSGFHTSSSGYGIGIIEGASEGRLHLRNASGVANTTQDFVIGNAANTVSFLWLGNALGNRVNIMNFDTAGNVGMGTSTPRKKLDVYAAASGDGIRITGNNAPGTSVGLDLSTYDPEIYSNFFQRSPTARIESVDVGGYTSQLRFMTKRFGSAGSDLVTRVAIGGNADSLYVEVGGINSWLARRSDNGYYFDSVSDRRLKTGIIRLSDALDTIQRIKPVRFHYNADYFAKHPGAEDKEHYGVIAQEFQEVFPGFVITGKDGFLSVKADPLIFVATAAIKELNAKFESSMKLKETEIAALKKQLADQAAAMKALAAKQATLAETLEARLAKLEQGSSATGTQTVKVALKK